MTCISITRSAVCFHASAISPIEEITCLGVSFYREGKMLDLEMTNMIVLFSLKK